MSDDDNKVPLPDVPDRPASASKDGQAQPPVSLSIDVDLINLDVVVTDNNNNPISGLQKEHFKVFDDNVEQTITNFSPTDAPLTVVILCEFGDTFGPGKFALARYRADGTLDPWFSGDGKLKTRFGSTGASAWDVAYAALFLHSDEAGFISGSLLPVDGAASASFGSYD